MGAGLSAPLWKGVTLTFALMIRKLIRRRLWLKSQRLSPTERCPSVSVLSRLFFPLRCDAAVNTAAMQAAGLFLKREPSVP